MQSFDSYFYGDTYGIYCPQVKGFIEKKDIVEARYATDAQPTLLTQSSAGIPAFLQNFMDPEVIRIFFTPNKASEIAGEEVKKGDWTTLTTTFTTIEPTGETSSYNDWSESGVSGVNVNFTPRDSYVYQTITQWGERELEVAGEASINYATELNISAANTLDRFQNNSYFYGVAGIRNYGLLNDASLSASIVPITKAAGGTSWDVATPDEMVNDIAKLFRQLVSQTAGMVDLQTPLTLALDPTSEANLARTNSFGLAVVDVLRKTYSNLRIVSAVQYGLGGSGKIVQLIATSLNGVKTIQTAYNVKMRAHNVVQLVSSFKQKKSAGTWGAIIRMPLAVASMIGV